MAWTIFFSAADGAGLADGLTEADGCGDAVAAPAPFRSGEADDPQPAAIASKTAASIMLTSFMIAFLLFFVSVLAIDIENLYQL